MADLTFRQVRSGNGANHAQRETLRSLRLGRIGRERTMADTPQLRGMIRTVAHLVEIKET